MRVSPVVEDGIGALPYFGGRELLRFRLDLGVARGAVRPGAERRAEDSLAR
jgi:hypothetical protein